MKKRPLLLKAIVVALVLSPVYYYLAPSIFFGVAPMNWTTFVSTQPTVKLVAMIIGPLVGLAVFSVRPIGWYAIAAFVVFTFGANLYLAASSASIHFTVLVATALSAVAGLYFVRREIRSPYFNPRLRWWEHARLRVRLGVEIVGKQAFECSTYDLSRTGAFLDTSIPFSIGERVVMKLRLTDQTIPAEGEVVWISDGSRSHHPPGVGVRFSTPVPGLQEAYRALQKQAQNAEPSPALGDSAVTTGR